MKKKELTYRFHNPNPDKVMENHIQQIMILNGVNQVFLSLENSIQPTAENKDLKEEASKNERCSILPCIDR